MCHYIIFYIISYTTIYDATTIYLHFHVCTMVWFSFRDCVPINPIILPCQKEKTDSPVLDKVYHLKRECRWAGAVGLRWHPVGGEGKEFRRRCDGVEPWMGSVCQWPVKQYFWLEGNTLTQHSRLLPTLGGMGVPCAMGSANSRHKSHGDGGRWFWTPAPDDQYSLEIGRVCP